MTLDIKITKECRNEIRKESLSPISRNTEHGDQVIQLRHTEDALSGLNPIIKKMPELYKKLCKPD